jgi:gluconokinase
MMRNDYGGRRPALLVADVGTTNVKAGIADSNGVLLRCVERRLVLRRGADGSAEHDAESVWRALRSATKDVLGNARRSVVGVVLSGYQLGLVPVSAAGDPLGGIVTLMDARSDEVYGSFPLRSAPWELYRLTGCPAMSRYPAAVLWWYRKKRPDVFSRTRWWLGVKDWLLLRMTGAAVTDPGSASGMQLLDISTGKWASSVLDALGVREEFLPVVREPHEVIGALLPHAADALGLPAGVPVLNGMYDGAATACGLGGELSGCAVMNVGTTAMLRSVAMRPVVDRREFPRFQTYLLSSGRWFAGGGVNNAGAVAAWYAASVAHVPVCVLEREAERIPPGCEGLRCIPTLVPERSACSGMSSGARFTGVRAFHGRAHFHRAILEGTAYLLSVIADGVREAGLPITEIRAGGGGTASALWMRILATMLDVPIVVSRETHVGLAGCALLGARVLFGRSRGKPQTATRRYAPETALRSRYRTVRAECAALIEAG